MNTRTFKKQLRSILARNQLLGASTEPAAIFRRLLKTQEELGEASEAFLSITGPQQENYKGLTVDDLREEVADVFLMVADVYVRWTKSVYPGCSDDDILDELLVFNRYRDEHFYPPVFEPCFVELNGAFGALFSRAARCWGSPDGLPELGFRLLMNQLVVASFWALSVSLPGETFDADERRRRYIELLNDKLNKWARVTGRPELVEPIIA